MLTAQIIKKEKTLTKYNIKRNFIEPCILVNSRKYQKTIDKIIKAVTKCN